MNFGIICEFNPFHAGHKHLFNSARALGAKNIVCAMSGNAVQRGELALTDKYIRARSAIENGADLALELPFPWSASSAEYFATAGVRALMPYCDAIIFGSECGDIDLLKKAADIALTKDFRDALENRKRNGEGAASAYFSLLEGYIGASLSSNDILGVEYIKAIKKCGASLVPYTVRRMGSAYRENNIQEGMLPSASAIREAIREGSESAEKYIDEPIKTALDNGLITDISNVERALLLHLRLSDASELSQYAECDGGVAERICYAARENADIKGFWDAVKTKRYTDAKLSRAILFSLAKVKRELLSESPEYLYLLGASDGGRALLSSARKGNKNAISVVTKPADAPRNSAQFAAEERLNALFSLAAKNAFSMGEAYRKNAFIIK